MSESIAKRIIGTWKLVSWVYVDETMTEYDFFGDNPSGILMYDAAGYMNAQLMKSERENFLSESLDSGTPEEISSAYKSYAAYYGKYYENSPGELIHVVEGSLFPNWVGHKEIRYGKIVGKYLYISTPPIQVDNKNLVFKVKWIRV